MSRGRVLGLALVISGILILVIGVGVMTGDTSTGLPVAGLGAAFIVGGGVATMTFKPKPRQPEKSRKQAASAAKPRRRRKQSRKR